jgi:hypothetical protein
VYDRTMLNEITRLWLKSCIGQQKTDSVIFALLLLDSLSHKTSSTMHSTAEPKQQSMIERVREAIGESLMGLAV